MIIYTPWSRPIDWLFTIDFFIFYLCLWGLSLLFILFNRFLLWSLRLLSFFLLTFPLKHLFLLNIKLQLCHLFLHMDIISMFFKPKVICLILIINICLKYIWFLIHLYILCGKNFAYWTYFDAFFLFLVLDAIVSTIVELQHDLLGVGLHLNAF